MEKTTVLSVTELTRRIKNTLEDEFIDVWVEGELSNFVRHSSGHMYFTLKDAGAQIQGVMFRSTNRSLSFTMENGLKVVICGRISVYEKRGNYQLYAERIEPKGIGALQLAYEQLKMKLREEGLFDETNKKELPLFPKKIGIVTSPTGAAIRDILRIIDRRFRNTHVVLNPAKVQGEGSAEEIATAINELNAHGECDVLIVGRGGGSLEDLWAFNEEIVVRAIHRSSIPIVSAVGHEVDYTISDFVADVRAATPSAAAELVVKEKGEWEAQIEGYRNMLQRSLSDVIDAYRQQIDSLTERLAFRQPQKMIQEYALRLDEISRHLQKSLKLIIQEKQSQFKETVAKLDMLSPLSILARGYSITYLKGSKKSVVNTADVHKGDVLVTRLSDGTVESQVV